MSAQVEHVAGKVFDYVIVGGGTAGLTLAARLSADPSVSVLVLEAGEAHLNNKDILTEQRYYLLLANKSYSYSHKWIAQQHAADRTGVWERGKGLGGSSAINFMGWFRPPGQDINDWEKLGNPNWNFSNYLDRVVRVEGLDVESGEGFVDTKEWKVGRSGPIKVSYPEVLGEGERRVLETFVNGGFKKNATPFNGDPSGCYLRPSNRDPKTNTRSYATTAYYEPNAHRTNLTVLVTATARRVLFSASANQNGEVEATGVDFEYGGKVYDVSAKKEVLLCAGTLSTPHLLELSGIGSRKVLSKIDVPLKVDLPGVGENMQEHIFAGLSYELKDDAPLDTLDPTKRTGEPPAVFKGGCGVVAHLTLSQLSSQPRAAELHSRISRILDELRTEVDEMERQGGEDVEGLQVKKGLVKQYAILKEKYACVEGEGSPGFQWICLPAFLSGPNKPTPGKKYITMMLVLNYGFSRGSIHATSSDPSEAPEIDPRYLSQDIGDSLTHLSLQLPPLFSDTNIADLDLMYEHFLSMRRLAELSPFKEMVAREHNPGPEVLSEEDVKTWIRKTFATIYHTVGTCSMLPRDSGGVVSPEMKVYGTTNVRVVDVSVVPLHVGANTQCTTKTDHDVFGIGNQAADIIQGKWPSA
ncbi:GMC oxidoreductase [Cytidiella melzeri]|nr:GMC oxidoreductase [Cytidiella melzeri]